AKVKEVEQRAGQAEARAQEAEARAQEAEARAQEAEARAQEAETKPLQAEAWAARVEASAQQAQPRTDKAEARTQEAETKARQAEAALQAVFRSYSWRITQPLRRLASTVRLLREKAIGASFNKMSNGSAHAPSMTAPREPMELSPRAREIYFQLKAAIK